MNMNTVQKLKLLTNELITAGYQAWLARRAEKPVRPSGKIRPLALPSSIIFAVKGRSI
jgi:hypothetical protein